MTSLLRPLSLVLGTALLAGSLAACGSAQTGTPAAGLTAAVAFYPFEFVVERVGGDLVDVENLTTPGAEPHDLELTPKQVGLLSTADLVVFQSGFQPAIDTALEQASPQRTVDVADFVEFLPAGEDDHAEEEHAGEEDEHGALDPHTWLDPTNLAAVAEHVRDALAQARPEAAAEFGSNTDALLAELDTLDKELSAGLANCSLRTFITSHAAFGYLAHRYDLEQVGIRGLEPDAEPSAARIAEVQQIATREGVTTIFFETLVSPVVAESIAHDLGLATDVLDPLEGLTDASRGSDYLEVMRANLAALQKANSCS
ncbi:MAG: metal ABC transporter substrate-binding protein [Propionicimonas sp.]|nr:metal ABC transporter substrate-binding protein [Propionicimonas sp.]